MYLDSDDIKGCVGLAIVATGFAVVLACSIIWLGSSTCAQKFNSFEHKWGFFSECQIKVNDRWIPADSYYIKEDLNGK